MSSSPKQDGKHDKKGERRQWDNGKKHRPRQPTEPRTVPMLVFGRDNFHLLKEALSTECLSKFWNLGKMIELGVYYVHVQPVKSDFVQFTDPDKAKIIYLEALKSWARVNTDMQLKLPMMYGVIWSYLSVESIDEVKNYETWDIYGA